MRNIWIALTVLLLTAVSCSEPELGLKDECFSNNYALSTLNGSGIVGGERDQYTDFGENPFINAAEDPISTLALMLTELRMPT